MNLEDSLDYHWRDRSSCYELLAKQDSDQWRRARLGACTSTTVPKILGHSLDSIDPARLAAQVCGLEPLPAVATEHLPFIHEGLVREPEVRQMTATKCSTTAVEVGLMVWKTDPYIRASPDGELLLSKGLSGLSTQQLNFDPAGLVNLEIKVAQHMYYPAASAAKIYQQTGRMPPAVDCMYSSHYDQIITAAGVTGAQGCIYSVACFNTSEHFITYVPFDERYWSKTIVPAVTQFHDDYVKPLIWKHNLNVIMPPGL